MPETKKKYEGMETGLVTQSWVTYYRCANSQSGAFCISDIYLVTADLDSENMLECLIKDYFTRSICCVWSDN